VLGSARIAAVEVSAVKKGLIVFLVVAALIVLVSPGIIGRIAERSVDENIEWADTESDEIVVTESMFDRGWFSSEGHHRIDIRDPEIRMALYDLFAVPAVDGSSSRRTSIMA
jgi:hypothetical protein